MGCTAALAASPGAAEPRVYAAGWDGRLRCFRPDGTLAWTLDLTPSMSDPEPMKMVAAAVPEASPGHELPTQPGDQIVQLRF